MQILRVNHNAPILKSTGQSFICIDNNILFFATVVKHRTPFDERGESCAASSKQSSLFEHFNQLCFAQLLEFRNHFVCVNRSEEWTRILLITNWNYFVFWLQLARFSLDIWKRIDLIRFENGNNFIWSFLFNQQSRSVVNTPPQPIRSL